VIDRITRMNLEKFLANDGNILSEAFRKVK
jgi:hypothetical protein